MFRSRASIAGLMGVVLVAALGLAGLRRGSATWASVIVLLTCGVLTFGVVGAACGGRDGRAWWLGFAGFGWVYLLLAFWSTIDPYSSPTLPTLELLADLVASLGAPRPLLRNGLYSYEGDVRYFAEIGHSLWGLLLATLGGVLARVFFGSTTAPTARPVDDRRQASRSSRRGWGRRAVLGLAGLLLFAAAALAWARKAPGLAAGATLLLTWGVLGLAAVGAAINRGTRRARWLGAALFGVGYLMLVSGHSQYGQTWPQAATNRLLLALRSRLPSVATERLAATNAIALANARALQALDRTVPMHFPRETPLEDVLKWIVAETRGPDGRDVPIYVDPIGLNEAERTMQSPVTLVMDGVPLRTTLRLILKQLMMRYEVDDGVIVITSEWRGEDHLEPAYDDPFLLIGQCLLSLVAAGLGGLLAPLVRPPGDEPAGREP